MLHYCNVAFRNMCLGGVPVIGPDRQGAGGGGCASAALFFQASLRRVRQDIDGQRPTRGFPDPMHLRKSFKVKLKSF